MIFLMIAAILFTFGVLAWASDQLEGEDDESAYAYPDHDEPAIRCPECGDDDRHERDCSRNYRNRTYGVAA